ncbi:MAG: hypothetical protein AAFR44_06235 [Pseudomonadota bacterium]
MARAQPIPIFAALTLAMTMVNSACGAGGGETDAEAAALSTRADLASVNTDTPTREDLITVCMYEQYTYTRADCACAADTAFETYSPKVRRLLVMDGGGAFEASQETLDLIATLTDEERDHYTRHGFYTMGQCAGRPVPE